MSEPHASVLERHPHLGEPRREGWVRVDLHAHTMFSGDSTTTFDELAGAVDGSGVDVVCVTDHGSIEGGRRAGGTVACRVVVGAEINTRRGEVIGLFLDEHVPPGLTPVDTARRIREQGGVVYVPHPFDAFRRHLAEDALVELVDAGLVDAVEVFNAKTSMASWNERAARFAREHGLREGAGSDAHVPGALGAAFVDMPDFEDAASFLDALRHAHVHGHRWDEPRPWSSRIVPSVAGR